MTNTHTPTHTHTFLARNLARIEQILTEISLFKKYYMKILKCCLSCPVPSMTHVIENDNIISAHTFGNELFFDTHMSLYLRYQGIYQDFSAPMVNRVPTSLLYP